MPRFMILFLSFIICFMCIYLIFTGMPLTVRYTSSAFAATYWLNHPSRSVKRLCTALSLTPPLPISFVTKMNVASCAVNLSNSASISFNVALMSGAELPVLASK